MRIKGFVQKGILAKLEIFEKDLKIVLDEIKVAENSTKSNNINSKPNETVNKSNETNTSTNSSLSNTIEEQFMSLTIKLKFLYSKENYFGNNKYE